MGLICFEQYNYTHMNVNIFYLWCIMPTYKLKPYYCDEYCFQNMDFAEAENLYEISILALVFEYEYFAADEIFNDYFRYPLANKEYHMIICQTKYLILKIFSLKTTSNENHNIFEWIKQIFKDLKDVKISNSLKTNFGNCYNIIINNSEKSLEYIHIVHKEIFFLFIHECKKRLKMKQNDYITCLIFFQSFDHKFYIDMKEKITSKDNCKIDNSPVEYEKNCHACLLTINFNMLGVYTLYFIEFFRKLKKNYEILKANRDFKYYLKENVTSQILHRIFNRGHAPFFAMVGNVEKLCNSLVAEKFDFDKVALVYIQKSVCADAIEFWLRGFFDFKKHEIGYYKDVFSDCFDSCLKDTIEFMNKIIHNAEYGYFDCTATINIYRI